MKKGSVCSPFPVYFVWILIVPEIVLEYKHIVLDTI